MSIFFFGEAEASFFLVKQQQKHLVSGKWKQEHLSFGEVEKGRVVLLPSSRVAVRLHRNGRKVETDAVRNSEDAVLCAVCK